ncbi:unnamed protein product [Anisakis simplex]|uniref:Uncharacterized protein n=1 Tax=Anisakis simplex TaxID=6269 RepID=A0A3P6U8L6_ANISI|nr:unnamed protein product [Anisakis simplex]
MQMEETSKIHRGSCASRKFVNCEPSSSSRWRVRQRIVEYRQQDFKSSANIRSICRREVLPDSDSESSSGSSPTDSAADGVEDGDGNEPKTYSDVADKTVRSPVRIASCSCELVFTSNAESRHASVTLIITMNPRGVRKGSLPERTYNGGAAESFVGKSHTKASYRIQKAFSVNENEISMADAAGDDHLPSDAVNENLIGKEDSPPSVALVEPSEFDGAEGTGGCAVVICCYCARYGRHFDCYFQYLKNAAYFQ